MEKQIENPQLNLPSYPFRTGKKNNKKWIYDAFRKKEVALSPEEWVRQHFLAWLVVEHNFPMNLIGVEVSLSLNKMQRRADGLVYSPEGKAVAVIECKAPTVKISRDTFDQIARYNMVYKVEYLFVTNGITHYACKYDKEKENYIFFDHIPDYKEIAGKED